MILIPGQKIHVIHRQLYEGDARRHFIGTVEVCDGGLALVNGYLFAMETKTNQFAKRNSLRTRIIPLASAEVIVNVLPEYVRIEEINYIHRSSGDVVVTDGSDWHLDLSHL